MNSSREAVDFGTIEFAALLPGDGGLIGIAQLAADSTSVCSTVCRSNVERLMTFSTSAVAVCCCSDSRDHRFAAQFLRQPVFSMAITACLAKLLSKLDLLVA